MAAVESSVSSSSVVRSALSKPGKSELILKEENSQLFFHCSLDYLFRWPPSSRSWLRNEASR